MKIENRQQLLIVVTVAAVALLFADRFILTPLGGVWSRRSDRIATLRKQIDDGDLLIRRQVRSLVERRVEEPGCGRGQQETCRLAVMAPHDLAPEWVG